MGFDSEYSGWNKDEHGGVSPWIIQDKLNNVGLNIKTFSSKYGFSRQGVAHVIHRRKISRNVATALSDAINCSVSDLFGDGYGEGWHKKEVYSDLSKNIITNLQSKKTIVELGFALNESTRKLNGQLKHLVLSGYVRKEKIQHNESIDPHNKCKYTYIAT